MGRHMLQSHGFHLNEYKLVAAWVTNTDNEREPYLICPKCSFITNRLDRHFQGGKHKLNYSNWNDAAEGKKMKRDMKDVSRFFMFIFYFFKPV